MMSLENPQTPLVMQYSYSSHSIKNFTFGGGWGGGGNTLGEELLPSEFYDVLTESESSPTKLLPTARMLGE